MNEAVLRIYMPISAKAPGDPGIWKELFGSSLAQYLAREAYKFGIEQTVVQRVAAGYLKGQKLVTSMPEMITPELPQVVELIDSEEKLSSFAQKYASALMSCKVILLYAKAPADAWATP
jgi:PII-like signaling protein